MNEMSKLNALGIDNTNLVTVKDTECLYQEKQEQIDALVDVLRYMGIEGLRLPSALDF